MAQAKIHGITEEYPERITWMEVAREHQKKYKYDILLVRVNGKLQELYKQVKGCELPFVIAKDRSRMFACQRNALLATLKVFYSMAGPGSMEELMTDFSIEWGFFMETRGNFVLDQEFLDAVKVKMGEHVEWKIPIMERSVSADDTTELFEKLGMYDKVRLFRYHMVSRVNIYSIDGSEDYYYGYIAQNTGYIRHFDLIPCHYGFVVVMPGRNTPDILHKLASSDKLFAILSESTEWDRRTDLETVDALNDRIARGGMSHLVLTQKVLQEKEVAEIAAQIVARKNAYFITITGPSLSGKITSPHRLSVQLEAIGLKPHPITVDNYFMNRMDSPRDEHGSYNYEILECLDMGLFNRDMTGLLEGKWVELPHYNFKKGVREYKENLLQLGEGDTLAIKGIHCLDNKPLYTLPTDSKLEIYISVLTQLSIDEHNHAPITDGRLLRGMVRDAGARSPSARGAIRVWPSVRRGEEKNIFPFQKEADIVLNSALVYELVVLKQYAQPLLSAIPRDSEEWLEAKRLFKFLDYFIGVNSEDIPKNSVLREFIGGSCLDVWRPQRGHRDGTDRFLTIMVQETAFFYVL